MSLKKSDEFKREAVQLALTSGLSTLNPWVCQHKHDDLMSDPHDELRDLDFTVSEK